MHQVKPFYQLLHAMLRNVLWKRFHQFNAFQRDGTIPAHLLGAFCDDNKMQMHLICVHLLIAILGSMWSQNWKLYENLIHPFTDFNLDDSLTNTNWSSIDMVKRADDFYRSLNLPAMTQEFWQQSVFEKSDSFNKCHGTAANMYQPNDYRFFLLLLNNYINLIHLAVLSLNAFSICSHLKNDSLCKAIDSRSLRYCT